MRTIHFRLFVLALALLAIPSCGGDRKGGVDVENPIMVSSPRPTTQIAGVKLSDTQKGLVEAGQKMSFGLLAQLYNGSNVVVSPLSLQYALSMAANGAEGETLGELLGFFGADDIHALNAYNTILLEQLPAVDLDVDLRLADALLVSNDYPLLPSFRQAVEENYYAAVENADFSQPEKVAARINEWAGRTTNGFIDKVLDPSEISPLTAAFLMNALYFKAKWAGRKPLFIEESTRYEDFSPEGSKPVKVPMMNTVGWLKYAECPGFKVLALPYEGSKFYMYFILPESGNDMDIVLQTLQRMSWGEIVAGLKNDAEVHVKIPRFAVENKYDLSETLQALGVEKAFGEDAEFGAMFDRPDQDFFISKVIQKSRIGVAEWGTEAAAVTIVEMEPTSVGPGEKQVYFYADRPFLFLIGESTSGTILFEGAYTGKE